MIMGNWQPWHQCKKNKEHVRYVIDPVNQDHRTCPVCMKSFRFNHSEKIRDWEEEKTLQ